MNPWRGTNCFLWAHVEHARRMRIWRAHGMQAGAEPYLVRRPSRKRPRWLSHWFVGRLEGDVLVLESYKPNDPTDAPWWELWRRLCFDGAVRQGDRP